MTRLEPEVGVSCARRFLEELLQGPELLVECHVHGLPICVQGILRTKWKLVEQFCSQTIVGGHRDHNTCPCHAGVFGDYLKEVGCAHLDILNVDGVRLVDQASCIDRRPVCAGQDE